jgi:glycosyltransferase involved in cell wall biosynthesis
MKPIVIFTRPRQWEKYKSDKLKLIHAPVFGDEPMLRNMVPMGDSVGGVAFPDGIANTILMCKKYRPQAFLFWAMYGFSDTDKRQLSSIREMIRSIKQVSPKTVIFYGNGNQFDTILHNEPDFNVKAYMPHIDVILDNTRDEKIHECYKKYGLKVESFYTFGFDPDEFDPPWEIKSEYDCFFGGSYTGQNRFPNSKIRHNLITRAAKKYNLLVRGRGPWPVEKKPYLNAVEYFREFGKTKLALGCYHADLYRYYTKRSIYALASGTPYVVRYIPGMEHDFENENHLVWWNSVDVALEKIDWLLNDISARNTIGENARRIAVENHSWEARLREFENIVERHI